jgi:hypothetical protein
VFPKLAAVSLSLLLAGAALAADGRQPRLALVGKTAVRGLHFRPHAAVRVVFSAGTPRARWVRTNARGSFTARLATPYDPCDGLTVTATAGHGVTGRLKLPKRECLPATLAIASDGTLQGRNFPPGQAVRVVSRGGGESSRLVQTDARGSFDTTLPAAGPDPCAALTITASAAGIATVVLKLPRPQRMCIVASSPS